MRHEAQPEHAAEQQHGAAAARPPHADVLTPCALHLLQEVLLRLLEHLVMLQRRLRAPRGRGGRRGARGALARGGGCGGLGVCEHGLGCLVEDPAERGARTDGGSGREQEDEADHLVAKVERDPAAHDHEPGRVGARWHEEQAPAHRPQ